MRDYGLQPLDEILNHLSLSNDDVVSASSEQLTHKQVQKARKGRHVTLNIKGKILRALRTRTGSQDYKLKDFFNYGNETSS